MIIVLCSHPFWNWATFMQLANISQYFGPLPVFIIWLKRQYLSKSSEILQRKDNWFATSTLNCEWSGVPRDVHLKYRWFVKSYNCSWNQWQAVGIVTKIALHDIAHSWIWKTIILQVGMEHGNLIIIIATNGGLISYIKLT